MSQPIVLFLGCVNHTRRQAACICVLVLAKGSLLVAGDVPQRARPSGAKCTCLFHGGFVKHRFDVSSKMTHFGGVKSASLPHSEQLLAGISEQGSWALVHASQEIRRDADFFLRAVAKDGACLMHAAEELCADEKAFSRGSRRPCLTLRCFKSSIRSRLCVGVCEVQQRVHSLYCS
ncbi:unnamed protein product [Durusdinium trenchii]|uniref:DUF4116 domain-containing protein n=1 Tax=Durusdinium trenchii TaxID=1381693 RepID=A0ABP0RR34_9DINO